MSDSLVQTFLHDVKNKLSNIKFSATFLLQHEERLDPAKKKKMLDIIVTSSEDTIKVIQEFFEVERYKRQKYLPKSTFDLKKLIEEILQELEGDIEAKGVTVRIDGEDVMVVHNKEWLKKALTNIIHNGIKYNVEQGFLRIELKKRRKVQILIENRAERTLSEDEIERIFKKYVTSKSKDSTGVGLSLTKAIIESFKGSIEVSSQEDKVCFTITLPRIAPDVSMKRFTKMMAAASVLLFVGGGYTLPIIPQNVQISQAQGAKVYDFENGLNIVADSEGDLKIEAYKTLFGSKYSTKVSLNRGDAKVRTNGAKIAFLAGGMGLSNMGTEFESVVKADRVATSVFEGKVKAGQKVVPERMGVVKEGTKVELAYLPKRVKELRRVGDTFKWKSPYKLFKVLVCKDKELTRAYLNVISENNFIYLADNLPDGRLYVAIFALDRGLLSLPTIGSFLFLTNYNKAKKFYESENYTMAKHYLVKSLRTIGEDSYKPYYLMAQILFRQGRTQEALRLMQKAYELDPKASVDRYIEMLDRLKAYKKIVSLSGYDLRKSGILMAKALIEVGDAQKAKELLWRYLTLYPEDSRAKELLKSVLPKDKLIQREL